MKQDRALRSGRASISSSTSVWSKPRVSAATLIRPRMALLAFLNSWMDSCRSSGSSSDV